MHELAHVSKHLSHADKKPYFDDVEGGDKDDREQEADNMALDALASKAEWANYMAMLMSPDSVLALAKKLSVHPAIIAGRYRKEAGDYRIFNRLIGNKEVREMIF
jgi:HTH-type transcriptional regulator/antitoxin HigA